jgi:hypothetical protein
MIDHATARSLVGTQLAAMGPAFPSDEWVIVDEYTIERAWGWVFFYDSRSHRETGAMEFAVLGNAPFLVRRADGAVFGAGTAYPIDVYIKDFEEGGRLIWRCG